MMLLITVTRKDVHAENLNAKKNIVNVLMQGNLVIKTVNVRIA
jgi:hypothetical protein